MDGKQIIVSRELIREVVDEHMRESGVLDLLDAAKKLAGTTDAAFALIEGDPHQWSARPCQTCAAVSSLLGRPFGCVKKQKG